MASNVAMLDEKWFYKRNRCRKLKELPPIEGKDPESCKLKRPKATSQRYPVKIIYMGVIARPRPEHNFDGKILPLRVSDVRQLTQATSNERFVDDAILNGMLKKGAWRELFHDGMTVSELRAVVCKNYQLEDSIGDRLTFSYSTYIGSSGNKNTKQLDDDIVITEVQFRKTAANETTALSIDDISMLVRYKKGEYIKDDVNCDSAFMLKNIRTVGEAIRTSFHWVAPEEKIYLQMDNAGGHGTVEAIEEYTRVLREEFCIEIVHQIP